MLAEKTLPTDMPAFLHTPDAIEIVGEMAREPDRFKGSGLTHDSGRDPGHFTDVDDNGKVLGGPALDSPAAHAGPVRHRTAQGGRRRIQGRLSPLTASSMDGSIW